MSEAIVDCLNTLNQILERIEESIQKGNPKTPLMLKIGLDTIVDVQSVIAANFLKANREYLLSDRIVIKLRGNKTITAEPATRQDFDTLIKALNQP